MTQTLERKAFTTSRVMDFFSAKELAAQTGHPEHEWPLVVVKELVDNSLDACEEAGVAPVIAVIVDDDGIQVMDNGPGIPPDTVEAMLDFTKRVNNYVPKTFAVRSRHICPNIPQPLGTTHFGV